jgi:hypothetical protein
MCPRIHPAPYWGHMRPRNRLRFACHARHISLCLTQLTILHEGSNIKSNSNESLPYQWCLKRRGCWSHPRLPRHAPGKDHAGEPHSRTPPSSHPLASMTPARTHPNPQNGHKPSSKSYLSAALIHLPTVQGNKERKCFAARL